MYNLSELIRQNELFSLDGIKATFIWPEMYYASSLQDFVENRNNINTSWKSKLKLDQKHLFAAQVCLDSCQYEQFQPLVNLPLVQRWNLLEQQVKTDFQSRNALEDIPVDSEKEILNRLKNGQLYDTTCAYPIMVRKTVPVGIPLYKVWLKYLPQHDFAEIESFELNYVHQQKRSAKEKSKVRNLILALDHL